MSLIRLIVLAMLLSSLSVHAENNDKYLAFFQKFVELGENFDPSVAELYSDKASINLITIMKDGTKKTTTLNGDKFKQMIPRLMILAKERGDIDRYSNISVSINGDLATIKADRYSEIKCVTDKDFSLVIANTEGGDLVINKQEFTSSSISKCSNENSSGLAILLKHRAEMTNKSLPLMVDEESQLVLTSSEQNTFTYHYVLVNILSSEIEPESLKDILLPILVKQSCTTTDLRMILDKGGELKYSYKGKDDKDILSIPINLEKCK